MFTRVKVKTLSQYGLKGKELNFLENFGFRQIFCLFLLKAKKNLDDLWCGRDRPIENKDIVVW